MEFKVTLDMLFSDTAVPDIFICDIMPSLPADCVKVYVYGLFLCKSNKGAKLEEIAEKLGLSIDALNASIVFLENENLLVRTPDGLTFVDVKAREVNSLYRMKEVSTPGEALSNTKLNQKRNSCIESMNRMFFDGLMPGEWYTFIDRLFSKYRFDEDVVVSLFQYCSDRGAKNRKYIETVASDWSSKKITSHFELEKYMEAYQKTRDLSYKIVKALRLGKNPSVYEEQMINKWANEFGYDMDQIEIALKRTMGKTISFKYIDSILSDWHRQGLKTKEEILAYCEKKKTTVRNEAAAAKIPQKNNFRQREYSSEFYDKFKNSTLK